MATLEPWSVDDIPSTVEHRSAIAAILSTDIETLTTFKDTLNATPARPIFESIVVILTLIRVRLLVPPPIMRSLTNNTVRTR